MRQLALPTIICVVLLFAGIAVAQIDGTPSDPELAVTATQFIQESNLTPNATVVTTTPDFAMETATALSVIATQEASLLDSVQQTAIVQTATAEAVFGGSVNPEPSSGVNSPLLIPVIALGIVIMMMIAGVIIYYLYKWLRDTGRLR